MNWATAEHDESDNQQRRWPRRWRLWIVLGVVAIIVAAIGLSFLIWQSQLNRQLAAIRARGEPTNFAELDAYYVAPPADQDATELWMRGAAMLSFVDVELAKLPLFGEAPEPPPPGTPWAEFDLARQFIADNAAALRVMHEAADRGGRARFRDMITPSGVIISLAHVQPLRQCARALILEAKVRAHEGNTQGAAESIAAGLILTRSLEGEPLIISQLVGIAIFSIAGAELKSSLPFLNLSDRDFALLQRALQNVDLASSLQHCMIGERAYGIALFDDPRNAGLSAWQVPLTRVVRGPDESFYLDIMTAYVKASQKPWPQALADSDLIALRINSNLTPLHVVTRNILASESMTIHFVARAEMTRRLLTIALALEQYRRREGHPAPSLDALVPAYLADLLDDLTSGEPFRYSTADEGYVVYSPSQRFPHPYDQVLDDETGANPLLLFRWPPRPAELRATDGEKPDDEADAAIAAPK